MSVCEPGKLVLTKDHELSTQLVDDLGLVFRLTVLQHVLYNVVAVLVVHEVLCLLVQLVEDSRHLVDVAVLQDALDHSTAVRMHCQLQHLHTQMYTQWCNGYDSGLMNKRLQVQSTLCSNHQSASE